MYQAIITPLVNIRLHPNADRIALATAAGHQVIVDLGAKEGELGVFFPTDGKLTREHLLQNNLYRKHPDTGEKMGGFFDANGRVRVQKFRGEISEGFWQPLDSLAWTGSISHLKQGTLFKEINGHKICEKYYSRSTHKAMNKMKRGHKKRKVYQMFPEHWETQKLRFFINSIPEGAVIHISEKVHGTSGRTGYIRAPLKLGKFKTWWNRYFSTKFPEHEWVYVSGTRRVVLDPDFTEDAGYYSGKKFRYQVHNMLRNAGLKKGEVIYYELVGYSEDGGLIMPSHTVKDKSFITQWGDKMVYKYGCNPNHPNECYKVLVYRITMNNEDGEITELTVPQIRARCKQLGLQTVPYIETRIFKDPEGLMLLCRSHADGPSSLDNSHTREGVVVRVESEDRIADYKFKGWLFCELEDIAKNFEEYVDPEDLA